MKKPEPPPLGTKVRIPWGFSLLDAEVVDYYDGPLGWMVTLRVPVPGIDPPAPEYDSIVTVNLDEIVAA